MKNRAAELSFRGGPVDCQNTPCSVTKKHFYFLQKMNLGIIAPIAIMTKSYLVPFSSFPFLRPLYLFNLFSTSIRVGMAGMAPRFSTQRAPAAQAKGRASGLPRSRA